MSSIFSSLSIPNYRRYFTGSLSGNIGTWMSITAKAWLVQMELTNSSATTLGWLTTVMLLPQFLLQPLGGMLADRFPKRRIALITQTLLCASAAVLSVFVLTGHIQLWLVFVLAAWDGMVTAFDNPARQAFVAEIVPAKSLTNAIGLNSSSWNGARLFGPAVAGIVIAALGTGWAFAVNAASFLVMIVMLLRMRNTIPRPRKSPSGSKDSGGLLDAWRSIRDRRHLSLLFFICFMMGTFGLNYGITNLLMATQTFQRGAGQYGILGSIMGIGSLAGALFAARLDRPRLRWVLAFLLAFVFALTISALSPNFWFFAVSQVPIGLCAISVLVIGSAIVQTSVPDNLRGRITALWGAATLGLAPGVSPLLGLIGDLLGARATVWVGAGAIALTFAAVAWYLFIKHRIRVHRVHRLHFQVEYPSPDADGVNRFER
ncbi:MAG: MFS transporter [Propionibacteriaceae bacterium]|nr:MFS transporter [Propionibacteriaceae bacterium]